MRATIATVAALIGLVSADSHLTSFSPRESFFKQNANLNQQPDANNALMIVGFALFGLAYLYTVFMIFYDTSKRDAETSELLANDEALIAELNINKSDPEFVKGLNDKLNAVKFEDKGDDQLYGTAAKLTAGEW